MKQTLAFSVAAALVAASAPALAGGPMEKGTFVVGAERLTGVMHASVKNDPFPGQNGPGNDDGVTAFSLLGNGDIRDPRFLGDSRHMMVIPRVGFDYFIIDGLSLGGSLTLLTVSVNDSNTPNDYSVTDFLFAPRVGYAYMFSDVVGIWPRGGFSYMHGSADPDVGSGESSHYFALEIEVPFIIAPVKNFGIGVGPLFDVTLGGSQTDHARIAPEQTRNASMTMFGLSAGIMGIF